jgi:hypothetical protein
MGPFVAMFILSVLVACATFIAYVGYVHVLLRRCSHANRTMTPGLVWLMVVPVLGAVWQFVVAASVSRTLESEYRSQGFPRGRGGLRKLGIAKSIVDAVALVHFGVLVSLVFADDAASASGVWSRGAEAVWEYGLLMANGLVLAAIVLWLIYWVRLAAAWGDINRLVIQEWGVRSWGRLPVPATRICRRCAQPLSMERFCPRCGAPADW